MTHPAQIGPRIYVACLAAYNNGELHGRWIDADQDLDIIREEIEAMLADSPVPDAEEYAIHDTDGFYSRIDEYEPLEGVQAKAEFIAEHGEIAGLLIENHHNVEAAREAIEDHYRGAWPSLEDYAADLIEECYEVPEGLRFYIDAESYGRDLELSGDIYTLQTSDYMVHIFDNY